MFRFSHVYSDSTPASCSPSRVPRCERRVNQAGARRDCIRGTAHERPSAVGEKGRSKLLLGMRMDLSHGKSLATRAANLERCRGSLDVVRAIRQRARRGRCWCHRDLTSALLNHRRRSPRNVGKQPSGSSGCAYLHELCTGSVN